MSQIIQNILPRELPNDCLTELAGEYYYKDVFGVLFKLKSTKIYNSYPLEIIPLEYPIPLVMEP
jgi:hypothetical protein